MDLLVHPSDPTPPTCKTFLHSYNLPKDLENTANKGDMPRRKTQRNKSNRKKTKKCGMKHRKPKQQISKSVCNEFQPTSQLKKYATNAIVQYQFKYGLDLHQRMLVLQQQFGSGAFVIAYLKQNELSTLPSYIVDRFKLGNEFKLCGEIIWLPKKKLDVVFQNSKIEAMRYDAENLFIITRKGKLPTQSNRILLKTSFNFNTTNSKLCITLATTKFSATRFCREFPDLTHSLRNRYKQNHLEMAVFICGITKEFEIAAANQKHPPSLVFPEKTIQKCAKMCRKLVGDDCKCSQCGILESQLKKKHNKDVEFQKCQGCKLVWFCSRKCQKKHWLIHKNYCSFKTIASFVNDVFGFISDEYKEKAMKLHGYKLFKLKEAAGEHYYAEKLHV